MLHRWQAILCHRFCYEINKHTNIHSFTPRTLHISHKSHSQIETSKTLNNSHLSIRNINDPINSSYHNDITPILTSNDTNEPSGDRIYATPIAYTPLKPHIFYRRLYFHFIVSFSLYYHWRYSLGLCDSRNRQRQSPSTLWPLYDYVTLFHCIHMSLLDPSIPYARLY